MVAGIVSAVVSILMKPMDVALHEDGLRLIRDGDFTEFPWKEVAAVKIWEWYDDRFSPMTYNIGLVPKDGGSEIRFNSGDVECGDELVAAIRDRVDEVSYTEWSQT